MAGLTAVIGGFASTKIACADRNLTIARTTLINVGAYAFGLALMIAWASVDRSIWSLVVANLVGSAAGAIVSHVALKGIKNRSAWERESVTAVIAGRRR